MRAIGEKGNFRIAESGAQAKEDVTPPVLPAQFLLPSGFQVRVGLDGAFDRHTVLCPQLSVEV